MGFLLFVLGAALALLLRAIYGRRPPRAGGRRRRGAAPLNLGTLDNSPPSLSRLYNKAFELGLDGGLATPGVIARKLMASNKYISQDMADEAESQCFQAWAYAERLLIELYDQSQGDHDLMWTGYRDQIDVEFPWISGGNRSRLYSRILYSWR